MKSTTYDYTSWRKGTVVNRRNGKVVERIDYCPVCGEKGAVAAAYIDSSSGTIMPERIYHKTTITMVGGFAMRSIDKCCYHFKAFERLCSAGALRSKAARKVAKRQIPDSDWPALPFEYPQAV